jgi:hypothetical protein
MLMMEFSRNLVERKEVNGFIGDQNCHCGGRRDTDMESGGWEGGPHFFFSVLGFEPRAFTSSFHQSFFVKGFYEIGSHEPFAQGWL